MPVVLEICHRTTYRYAQPVRFGEHRLLFRPRAAHDLRVLHTELSVNLPAEVVWIQDVYSNSLACVTPQAESNCLQFDCRSQIEHFGVENENLPLDPHARQHPFHYPPEQRTDLEHYLRPHSEDPDGLLMRWTRQRLAAAGGDTRALLGEVADTIASGLRYQARDAEGTQAPAETLERGSGTCRDFAWLMIEALRRLGFACRFVTGYLYDPALDGGAPGVVGAGATHAWLQVFLPGAGWVPYDPTNRLTGGTQLIRVGYAREPAQASPLAGSWYGNSGDYLGMAVEVTVRKLDTAAQALG